MPIYRLLKGTAFDPEFMTVMGNAFEDLLQTLGLVDRNDPLTEMIARKLIELAKAGERNPARLKAPTLEAFKGASFS